MLLCRYLALTLCLGCATTEVAEPPPRPAPLARAPAKRPPAPAPVSSISPAEVQQARQLAEQGVRLYREGQYGQAEEKLKLSISLYPFMAETNLVLAKILLIRASAARDMTLYTNARLMLEMARALDPRSREVEQLLELVRQPQAD